MANPTNPFNWQMPTSTDLVTDLPADFEVFGQAVATSMADLLGGTTGQVLSKASNTNMDFTWVTTDDANAIQNSIVDAKGDIVAASANDTPARLAVGANGTSLVADSTQTTGLGWVATPSASNPVLNSAMQVWQRGTASTAIGSGTFLADRWQAARTGFAAGASQSQQVTGDTTNLPNIQYCLRVGRDTGNTSTASVIVGQNIETVNSIPFAGKTVTLSFYARKGALYSGSSNLLALDFASGTGTDQNLVTSGTLTGINNTNTTFTLSATWQRFTITKAIDSTATQLAFQYFYVPVGTAGATDYFEFTGVQIDIGSVALPFRTAGVTYQEELAMCKRYLPSVSPADAIGYAYGTDLALYHLPFDVQARVAPTGVTLIGTYQAYALNVGSTVTPAFNLGKVSGASVTAGLTITAGQGSRLQAQSTATILFTGCEL